MRKPDVSRARRSYDAANLEAARIYVEKGWGGIFAELAAVELRKAVLKEKEECA